MFHLDKFIADHVTHRPVSMFQADIEANRETLEREIAGRKVCVIGGAGSIGSSFIRAVLRFRPQSVVVVDLNENGLAELVRDVRSTEGLFVPDEFRCYTLNFADPIFERIFREERGFDIVANFSAHKHVRSEKDRYSVQALIENNDIKARRLMDLLAQYPPRHFFCVSTDKAANPVNIMGASKRIMEDLVMAYCQYFPVTTARFANVAFSNGSLPDGWLHRVQRVRRYFVSPEESGQICMLACILGRPGEVFFPKLGEDQMLTFSSICDDFVRAQGFEKDPCASDQEAKHKAAALSSRVLSRDLNTVVEHVALDQRSLATNGTQEVQALKYPTVYFKSDTTGEKAYEEFYVPGEKLDMDRFSSLGVVQQTVRHTKEEVDTFFTHLESIFAREDFTKAEVVEAIKRFIPNFMHEEKGKNLDNKM